MIEREKQTVSVVSYTTGTDAYGQKRQNGSTTRNIEMIIHYYQQSNVSDPRFVDVVLVGLTKDQSITTANTITVGGKSYNVKYVIPSARWYQVFMG